MFEKDKHKEKITCGKKRATRFLPITPENKNN